MGALPSLFSLACYQSNSMSALRQPVCFYNSAYPIFPSYKDSITNADMLIGSIVSGELTTTFGYSATFIPAIVAFAVSFAMLSRTSGKKALSL
jgi:hypothetical protein